MPRSAVKFTQGDSKGNPPGVKNSQGGGHPHAKEPKAKSHTLRSGNTASGMPGFIATRANGRRGDQAQGGKGVGPHREEDIGERTHRTVERMDEPGNGGTMRKGGLKGAGAKGVQSNAPMGRHGPSGGTPKMKGDNPPPMSRGRQPAMSLKMSRAPRLENRGNALHRGSGSGKRGTMESLAAKSGFEGKRKSSLMY